ncbi:LOW QUALITY PROTEIN: putative tubulin polyglutamylase TTLL9 [Pluvialis apricaria]
MAGSGRARLAWDHCPWQAGLFPARLYRARGDLGRRPPRLLPRPFPGCCSHREQTKEEKLPLCAAARERGGRAGCCLSPLPHKAAVLGEEQNLCPAPSRKLSQKNYLVKNLKRFWKQLEREAGKLEATKCVFIPKTFKMPSEYHLFVEEFRKNPGITWILKPYIPLKAWLSRGGFARFSNTRFTLNSRGDHCMLPCLFVFDPYLYFIPDTHLTNVAVQKTVCDYDPGKVIQQLGQCLTARCGAGSVEVLFVDMDNTFIHSLQSVQKVVSSDNCFELYSYDILIHHDLKHWLLEVNASPSLTARSQEDCELKCCLLKYTLHIVDRESRLTGKEKRVGGCDLIWNDGPVSRGEGLSTLVNKNVMTNTYLGCYGDRKKLKQLFRNLPAQQKV